jgi:hypothetical protein
MFLLLFSEILVDGRYAKLVLQSVAALCDSLKTWQLQAGTKV